MKTHEQFADDLALHALNEPTGSERQEFEQHLETCASCRREVQALRGDMGLLALSAAGPNPPARSNERLMRAIAAEPRGMSAQATEKARRRGFVWAWIPTVAAVALLLLAAALKLDNARLEEDLASLSSLHRGTASELAKAEEQLRLLSAPDAVQVSLSAQAESRKPHATAIYSPSQKRMMLMASNLAPVPAGKAYELWVIPTVGAPINAGVFKPDEHGNALMMDHAMPEGVVAKAFAVTLENEAGSDKPTMPILIVGAGE